MSNWCYGTHKHTASCWFPWYRFSYIARGCFRPNWSLCIPTARRASRQSDERPSPTLLRWGRRRATETWGSMSFEALARVHSRWEKCVRSRNARSCRLNKRKVHDRGKIARSWLLSTVLRLQIAKNRSPRRQSNSHKNFIMWIFHLLERKKNCIKK